MLTHAPSPTDTVDIVEVPGRAEQGLSRPLRCVGADGDLYYVKGQQPKRSSLWRGWICGYLARALDDDRAGLHTPSRRSSRSRLKSVSGRSRSFRT